MAVKVEFIESYIHTGEGDYMWNDNHGELVRCPRCDYCNTEYPSGNMTCQRIHPAFEVTDRDYCSFAKKKETEHDED